MFDFLALPGIGYVYLRVGGLDHRRIGELAIGFIFQNGNVFPALSIRGDRDIQWASSLFGVVVDDNMPTVLEGHRIDTRVGIKERGGG